MLQSRLITAVALTLLFAACLAVAVSWASGEDQAGDDGIDLSTGEVAAPASDDGSTAPDSASDSSLPEDAWWRAYDPVGGQVPAGDGDPASGEDASGATSPSTPDALQDASSSTTSTGSTSTEPEQEPSGSTRPGSTANSSSTTSATAAPTTSTTAEPTTAPAPKLAVFGVEHDDVLNVRSGAGVGNEIIGRLSPTEDGVVALGPRETLSDNTVWFEVDARGRTGWSASRYLFTRGSTRDATSQVVDQVGGTPSASSLAELGRTVAGHLTGGGSRIVMSVGPSGSEVTYDVVGGSAGSFRVRVVAESSGSGGYSLQSASLTNYSPS